MAANDVETAVHRVRGYEFHPGAAKTARAAVTNHLIARGWNGGIASSAADRIIETTDFLLSPVPCSSYDVVAANPRSEEHTSELQSLMRLSYAVFCLKTKKTN